MPQLLWLCRHTALACRQPLCWLFWRALIVGKGGGSSRRRSSSAARWSLMLAPLQPRAAERLAPCRAGGKTVLLVGAGGAVGAALHCMLQREGAATLSCRWKAPQLQTKVSTLLSAQFPGGHRASLSAARVALLPLAAIPERETHHFSHRWHWSSLVASVG